MTNQYELYLQALKKPFQKLTKLEFLQPDNSVAFTLGNSFVRGYSNPYDSRAFIQGGTLNVALKNGQRRTASLTLSNIDDVFDYSVNKIWYGTKVRLSMGLVLPNGEEFYLPQGVFYFRDPQKIYNPTSKQMNYSLVDKWSYLDGSLFGVLPTTKTINADENYFDAALSLLHLSKYDLLSITNNIYDQVDNVPPIFTDYYNNKPEVEVMTFIPGESTPQSRMVPANCTPYEIRKEFGSTLADILLELNTCCVGLIGYDPTGALRMDAAQASITDTDKPTLWLFDPSNSQLCGTTEVARNTEVYNTILIVGEGLQDNLIWCKVSNVDDSTDTSVNRIGVKVFKEEKSSFWKTQQCIDYAQYIIKQRTILQKSISLTSSQMFHLQENNVVSIMRTDKKGSPIERHLIQSFSLPLGETGEMTINATSVNDYNIQTVVESSDDEEN